jgi:hypothetical protein
MAERVTPIIPAFEAGKLRFRRTDRAPNRWEIIEP